MFQYSFVLKSITCIIYLIEKETSSEIIEKLSEISSILKSHAYANVTQNVIKQFLVTIDCVRFLIRGFPLYTYSMAKDNLLFNTTFWTQQSLGIKNHIHTNQRNQIDNGSMYVFIVFQISSKG